MAQVVKVLFEEREVPSSKPVRRHEFFAYILNVTSDEF